MNTDALSKELHNFNELKRRLLEAEPEIDESTLHDTLEGATTLFEALSAAARSVLDDETMIFALKKRFEDVSARMTRLSETAASKRAAILHVMQKAEINTLKEPDLTLSVKSGKHSLEVVDESQVPEWFWIPQPPRIDRQRLTASLKAGEHINGATLLEPKPHLQIRTK